MDKNSKKYRYIDEESLLKDSFQLAVNIYESGFKPDFIVAIWRGGATVGIYVQECLQALGVQTDHIAIRTSYQGMEKYEATMTNPQTIRVHGL
ncbi:MAG: hypoxanthine phosphoribosyltransferase, partial [OM182 bacterium]